MDFKNFELPITPSGYIDPAFIQECHTLNRYLKKMGLECTESIFSLYSLLRIRNHILEQSSSDPYNVYRLSTLFSPYDIIRGINDCFAIHFKEYKDGMLLSEATIQRIKEVEKCF